MEKTERYYTPKIDEFCEGFEYEIEVYDKFGDKENGVEPKWIKSTFSFKNQIAGDDHKFFLPKGRVKYLDREDLESLGWAVIKEPYRWQWEYTSGRYKMFTDIYLTKEDFPIPHPNSGSIKIIDNRDADDFSIFYGYIKNKSEMKRLMKQLDIINFLD